MPQMYKVFFNDKLVLLTDEHISERNLSGFCYLRYDHPEEIGLALNMLDSAHVVHGIILYCEDLDSLWENFQAHFTLIEAAGGLVRNSKNEFLCIYRNDKWDLPKGKLEKGETIAEGALREVEEECGVKDLILGDHLIDTYHTYSFKGKEVLKRTYWYEMSSNQETFLPQEEEGITRVEWKKLKNSELTDWDTYPNIRLVLEAAMA